MGYQLHQEGARTVVARLAHGSGIGLLPLSLALGTHDFKSNIEFLL